MTATDPQTLPLDDALKQAIAHHQAGRLQEAERLYRAVLQAQPDQQDANHNLGVLAVQVKQPAASLPYFKAALEGNPNQEQYWLSYIDALTQTGQTEAAQSVLAQGRQAGLSGKAVEALAMRLDGGARALRRANADLQHTFKGSSPNSSAAPHKEKYSSPQDMIDMLEALFSRGRYSEMGTIAQKMTVRFPDHGVGWKVLGAVFKQMGRNAEALVAMQKAAMLSPDDVEAHYNLGNALRELDRLEEAEASYRRALQIKQDDAEAHCNLGVTLMGLGRLGDAEASYRRALQIKQDYAEAHYNMGVILQELGRLGGAEASYRRALQIKPDYAEAHNNLGVTLMNLDRFDDARASYRRALQVKPDYSEAHSNLLFVCNFMPNQSPASMLAEALRYGELVARLAHPYKAWSNVPDPDRCLRVGLVSGDMRTHPVGYFLEGILAELSKLATGRLEFHAYSNHPYTDAVTGRIKTCCRNWHSAAALSDEALARRIHDDGIDILLDLSGHTAHNRLPVFAWKPAPIQAAWLGYFATTGVAAMDYLIADPWTLPEAEEIHFTEKILRLHETRLCFTPPDVEVKIAPLPALANGNITFGCFNNLGKMNDAVVALWVRVLASIPGSRLFLKAKQLNDAATRQGIVERFAAQGVCADRLILEGSEPREKYLAAYQRVDIALDPFPYTGGTTSVESLWMGVPVLTLSGESFLSRQGVGILMNAGLPEWIAAGADDYVARAVLHAGDLQRLAMLRKGLRQQVLASPIFDAPRFARNFEAALRGMWRKWCD